MKFVLAVFAIFEDIFNALTDNSKEIGEEFDYNIPELDIYGENAKNCVRAFILENLDVLIDKDETD